MIYNITRIKNDKPSYKIQINKNPWKNTATIIRPKQPYKNQEINKDQKEINYIRINIKNQNTIPNQTININKKKFKITHQPYLNPW